MNSIESCEGCIRNQPAQMAHMGPGGCLNEPYLLEERLGRVSTDNFCPICETDGCENISRYIEEENDDEENNFARDYDNTHHNDLQSALEGNSIDNDTNTNTINLNNATWHNAPSGFSDIMTAAHNMLHLNALNSLGIPTSNESNEDTEEHEHLGWSISREPEPTFNEMRNRERRRESNLFLPFNELPDADWNRVTINQTINNINLQYSDEEGIVVDSKTKKELVPIIENPIDCKTCCICLEDIKKTDIFITRCGHQFHGGCMLKHMKTHDNCPMCRGVLINT